MGITGIAWLYGIAIILKSIGGELTRFPFVSDGNDDQPFSVDEKKKPDYDINLYLYSVSFHYFV